MKKILSLVVSLALASNLIGNAHAANPKVTFTTDCNTQEKQVVMGYQSNPDDLPAGEEIIALKFTFRISPTGSTTFDDIKNVTLLANPAYTTFIVAENTKTQNTANVDIKIAGGFTGGNGATHASDLIFVKGIDQKEFQIQVLSGELYPKNSTTNIYQATNESYTANPASCGQSTNTGTTNTTTTNTNTGSTSTTTSQDTEITVSSNKATAKAGDEVVVTAIIKNRDGKSIDWSQTTGAQITPNITNEELPNSETKSLLKFTMVESTQDITLRVTVDDVTEKITIKTGSSQPTATPTTGTQTGTSLQEKLQERLEGLNSTATKNAAPTTPGNVHGAAGSLSQSGPQETTAIILLSLALLLAWKKLRRSELDVNV